MHELGITQSVVEAVLDQVGDVRITRVELEIGRLAGVVPDSMHFCFELVVAGTPLDGARLDIVQIPGRGRCRDCDRELELGDPIVLCECGSADVMVLTGEELRVRAVEVV